MVRYSPKDNTYKEMYLINKFEKDIMESSLQNLSNNKNKNQAEKYTSPININVENNKESLENIMSKSTPISESNQKQLSNTGGVINVSEDVDSSISVDNPQNSSISKDDDSLGKSDKPKSSKNDSLLSPSNLKRIISSEKRAMEKIKSLTCNEKKRKEFKNFKNKKIPKSLELRATRKMVKSNNKKKKGVIVKHPIDPISIVSLRKKNNENVKQIADQIFKSWKV